MWKGGGNSYTTEFRQYDPRLGRWMSLDPLMADYPDMSPYVAFNNNPVYFVDPLGLEGGPAKQLIGVSNTGTSTSIHDGLPNNPIDGKVYRANSGKEYYWLNNIEGVAGKWYRYDGEGLVIGHQIPNNNYIRRLQLATTHGFSDAVANSMSIGLFDVFKNDPTLNYTLDEKIAYYSGQVAGYGVAAGTGDGLIKGGISLAAGGAATGVGALVLTSTGVAVAIYGGAVTARAIANGAIASVKLGQLLKQTSLNMSSNDTGSSGSSTNSSSGSGSGATKRVGAVLRGVDDVITNPGLLEGKTLSEVQSILKNTSGWKEGTMNQGRSAGKGWTMRQLNSTGKDVTDLYIQYHPGTHRHFNGNPYWKVSSGKGGVQWFEAGK